MPKKILVIDDSPTVLLKTRMVLEEEGYVVSTLEGAVGASTVIRKQRPDLILLDLTMPGVDGEQLLDVINGFGIAPGTRVVLYSSEDTTILELITARANADGFIHKSSPIEQMLAEVEKHLAGLDSDA